MKTTDMTLTEHERDLNVIEGEIKRVQADKYYGNIILSFNAGILCPILSRHETKKIKERGV